MKKPRKLPIPPRSLSNAARSCCLGLCGLAVSCAPDLVHISPITLAASISDDAVPASGSELKVPGSQTVPVGEELCGALRWNWDSASFAGQPIKPSKTYFVLGTCATDDNGRACAALVEAARYQFVIPDGAHSRLHLLRKDEDGVRSNVLEIFRLNDGGKKSRATPHAIAIDASGWVFGAFPYSVFALHMDRPRIVYLTDPEKGWVESMSFQMEGEMPTIFVKCRNFSGETVLRVDLPIAGSK